MTATARKTLRDLQVARALLAMEESTDRFREALAGINCAFSRSGHVLRKVDSNTSPQRKAAISPV